MKTNMKTPRSIDKDNRKKSKSKSTRIKKLIIEEEPVEDIIFRIDKVDKNDRSNKLLKNLVIRSKIGKKFNNFEQMIFSLKTVLLKDKQKLTFISRDLQSIFKDRNQKKLPEKILNVFQSH